MRRILTGRGVINMQISITIFKHKIYFSVFYLYVFQYSGIIDCESLADLPIRLLELLYMFEPRYIFIDDYDESFSREDIRYLEGCLSAWCEYYGSVYEYFCEEWLEYLCSENETIPNDLSQLEEWFNEKANVISRNNLLSTQFAKGIVYCEAYNRMIEIEMKRAEQFSVEDWMKGE